MFKCLPFSFWKLDSRDEGNSHRNSVSQVKSYLCIYFFSKNIGLPVKEYLNGEKNILMQDRLTKLNATHAIYESQKDAEDYLYARARNIDNPKAAYIFRMGYDANGVKFLISQGQFNKGVIDVINYQDTLKLRADSGYPVEIIKNDAFDPQLTIRDWQASVQTSVSNPPLSASIAHM